MKLFTAAICAAMLLTASTGAMAAGPYLSFSAGAFMPEDSKLTDTDGFTAEASFKSGGVLTGAFGYAAPGGLRVEGEVSHRFAEMDSVGADGFAMDIDADVKATSMMGNIYYDIQTGGPVKPYFGGGVGFSTVTVGEGTYYDQGFRETMWDEDEDTVLAAQLALGVGISFNEHVTLDLGYRYFVTEELQFDFTDAEFASHNLTAGMRFTF